MTTRAVLGLVAAAVVLAGCTGTGAAPGPSTPAAQACPKPGTAQAAADGVLDGTLADVLTSKDGLDVCVISTKQVALPEGSRIPGEPGTEVVISLTNRASAERPVASSWQVFGSPTSESRFNQVHQDPASLPSHLKAGESVTFRGYIGRPPSSMEQVCLRYDTVRLCGKPA